MIEIALIVLLVVNVIAFITYGVDKYKAQMHQFRVPEATLLWLAAFGGSIGALSAMELFHHKTNHRAFMIGVPVILFIQLFIALMVFIYI